MSGRKPFVKTRLDRLLVEQGLASTRSRARDLIKQGHVLVDGAPLGKPSAMVHPFAVVSLADTAWTYVSRSALKLQAALRRFELTVDNCVCLDIGASTGGFTQVLLEAGALVVYAVDVGRDQLADDLSNNPRVVPLQGCDARRLTVEIVPEPVDAITADVSFISLRLALPVPLSLARPGAWLVALIKPQFEVGRLGIGKRGIVHDAEVQAAAVATIHQWLDVQSGWSVIGVEPSPIPGKAGNREFLICAKHEA